MHHMLTEDLVRKIAFYTGLGALAAGIGMAFEYGRAMSYLHAVSLGLLAIGVSIAFVGAKMARNNGSQIGGVLLTAIAMGLSVGEYGTHFGYTVGNRVADSQQTGVHNAAYKAVQDNRASEKHNLELWIDQRSQLMAARAERLKLNPWITSASSEGLQDQIANMEGDFVFKRSKQCADVTLPESRRFCDKRAGLKNQLGSINEFNHDAEEVAKLDKQIEATQRVLDKKTEKATTATYQSSKIVNQTAGFAQLAAWTDEPSDSIISWTQLVLGAIIALITTYLAPICFNVAMPNHMAQAAAFGRRPEDHRFTPQPEHAAMTVMGSPALHTHQIAPPAPVAYAPPSAPPAPARIEFHGPDFAGHATGMLAHGAAWAAK